MKLDKGEQIKNIVDNLQKKTPQKAENPSLVQKEIKKELTKKDKKEETPKKDPKKEKIASIVSKVKSLLNK